MPRASKKSSSSPTKPAFATGGSFQALIVEDVVSDESDRDSPPVSPPVKIPSTPLSSSTKKGRAKQRARDRARKMATNNESTSFLEAEQPSSPTQSKPSSNSSSPGQAEQKLQTSSPAMRDPLQIEGTKLRSGKLISTHDPVTAGSPVTPTPQNFQIISALKTDIDRPPNLESESLSPTRAPQDKPSDTPDTPTTSTSASIANSITTSPSTTDLDEDEDPGSGQQLEAIQHQASTHSKALEEMDGERTPSWTQVKSGRRGSGAREVPLNGQTAFPSHSKLEDNARNAEKDKSPTTKSSSPRHSTQPDPNLAYGADHAPGKKWQSVITRVIWSLVMVGVFVGLMTLGHVYLIVLVFIIQLSVFREVSNLFEVGYKASAREHARKQANVTSPGHHPSSLSLAAKERKRIKDVDKNRWSKVMSWYFFCAVNYFLYGESIIYYFKHIVFIDVYLLPFARHHRFISLLLYLVGFLAFVANLDRGHLRRQFGLFSWIHMSLLLIVASGQFMVNNILEGLIWFWVPASLVIMNDVAAYVFGMLFGKHQLIKLSPKKTVEGFVGGYFSTVIFGVVWGSLFMGWNYMICPVRDLGVTAFSDVQCVPNNAFVWRSFNLPETLIELLSMIWSVPPTQIWWTPFQIHCLVLATFAGLVAPFGGFFASGFKRAFNVKDFADTIPGHGGLTDRFDCQFIMGLFTYFYYTSMVREQHITVGSVLEIIASSLNSSEQLELYHDLKKSLVNQGYQLNNR